MARRAALGLADGRLRPERKGIPLVERLLRPLVFWRARRSVLAKTGGHYPAPLVALEVVEQGTATTLAEGLVLEARAFGRLSVTRRVAGARLGLLRDTGHQEGHRRPGGNARRAKSRKLGVLGAGLMGSGIACVAAEAGVPVRIKDASLEALGRGLQQARGVYDERRKRRSLTLARGGPAHGPHLAQPRPAAASLARDLVIEAVFEDLELKRRVLAEVESVIPGGGRVREQHLVDPDRRDRAGLPAPGARAGHALLLAGAEDAAARGRGDTRDRAVRRSRPRPASGGAWAST